MFYKDRIQHLESEVACLKLDIAHHDKRYWRLARKFYALLARLELDIEETPAKSAGFVVKPAAIVAMKGSAAKVE